jgi:sugar phosphate isomerase/epimerase
MAAEARKNGITVAVEPLNKKETNMLLTTEEVMSYIRELNLPNLKLLVDLYHFYCEGESLDRIDEYGPYIHHVHIVEPTHRTFMRPGDAYDYAGFVKALAEVGYDGALMFEGGGENYDTGITETYPILRALSLEA